MHATPRKWNDFKRPGGPPTDLIKFKHETFSKRCQSSKLFLASRQAWPKILGEVSMFVDKVPPAPKKVSRQNTAREASSFSQPTHSRRINDSAF